MHLFQKQKMINRLKFIFIKINGLMRTPEGTGRAEDYRMRLFSRKANAFNTKFYYKRKRQDDCLLIIILALPLYFGIYFPDAFYSE